MMIEQKVDVLVDSDVCMPLYGDAERERIYEQIKV